MSCYQVIFSSAMLSAWNRDRPVPHTKSTYRALFASTSIGNIQVRINSSAVSEDALVIYRPTTVLSFGPTMFHGVPSTIIVSQLDDLVAQLRETEPHYIKCIKPNSDKAPGGWTSSLVIEQLRYSGVLEVSPAR